MIFIASSLNNLNKLNLRFYFLDRGYIEILGKRGGRGEADWRGCYNGKNRRRC